MWCFTRISPGNPRYFIITDSVEDFLNYSVKTGPKTFKEKGGSLSN